jgi:hypothetical protein
MCNCGTWYASFISWSSSELLHPDMLRYYHTTDSGIEGFVIPVNCGQTNYLKCHPRFDVCAFD